MCSLRDVMGHNTTGGLGRGQEIKSQHYFSDAFTANPLSLGVPLHTDFIALI